MSREKPQPRSAPAIVGGETSKQLGLDAPGKRALHDGPTGAPWADSGGTCDDPKAAPKGACTLSARARSALTTLLMRRITVVEAHYQTAMERARIANLLKKPEELSWFISTVLSIATDFVSGKISDAMISLKDGSEVKGVIAEASETDPDLDMGDFEIDIGLDFRGKGDDAIKGVVKSALGSLKKAIAGGENSNQVYDKAATGSYLDQLSTEVAIAFDKLASTLPATATDAELIAYYHAMHPRNHAVAAYEAMLTNKIQRFLATAGDIGRRNKQSSSGSNERDTRVVWVEYVSGHPRALFTQTYDYANPMMTQMPDFKTDAFASGRSEGEVSYEVPSEFTDVAIARHKEQWKTDPATVTIDEDTQGNYWQRDPLRAYKARQKKQTQMLPSHQPTTVSGSPGAVAAGGKKLAPVNPGPSVATNPDPLGIQKAADPDPFGISAASQSVVRRKDVP